MIRVGLRDDLACRHRSTQKSVTTHGVDNKCEVCGVENVRVRLCDFQRGAVVGSEEDFKERLVSYTLVYVRTYRYALSCSSVVLREEAPTG